MDYQRACSCRGTRVGGARVNPEWMRQVQQRQRDNGCTPSDEYAPNSFEYPSLAMSYFPYQKWGDLYEPSEALRRATLFVELDKPFLAGRRGGCQTR